MSLWFVFRLWGYRIMSATSGDLIHSLVLLQFPLLTGAMKELIVMT